MLPVDCVRKIVGLQFTGLAITDPPAVSECIQVPNHSPIRLHVLISGDAVVVSTQASDRVPVGAGQYDL